MTTQPQPIPEPMPRKKSRLWKWTLWMVVALLLAEIIWMVTVPLFRGRLRIERATPRIQWLTWPAEVDKQKPTEIVPLIMGNGPYLVEPEITSRSGGGRLASMTLSAELCWTEPPQKNEPWNVRIEMSVVAAQDERFLSTTRGTMRPEYQSKELVWNQGDLCEPVRLHADFALPRDTKFYGYILRVFYKDEMSFVMSTPPGLADYFPFANTEN